MPKDKKIFLVDSDIFYLGRQKAYLESKGYLDIDLFLNLKVCINNLMKKPKVLFLSYNTLERENFETLKKIKQTDLHVFIILIFEEKDKTLGIESMKTGAFDFIVQGENMQLQMMETLIRIKKSTNK